VILPALKTVPLPRAASKAEIDCAIAHQFEEQGKLEEALQVANGVLDDDPDDAVALLIAGRVCLKMQKHGLAYNILKRSLSLKERYDTRINVAAACIGMQRLEEARRITQELRRMKPQDEKALALLCLLAVYECNPRLAIDLGEKALSLKAGQFDVHESLGYAHLMLGEWPQGWDGYEKFIGHSKYRPLKPPYEGCPYWDGSDGLDLYIRGEQGLGDEISFASILPEIMPRMKSVVYDCDEKLGGLMKRSFPNAEVHATRKGKNADKDWLRGRTFDAHTLIGTLASHRRQRSSDFPGTPYLVADPQRRVQWRALLDTLPGKKVGLAWTGGSRGTFSGRRSLALDAMLPLLQTEGVSWVSLQYQDPSDDIREFEEAHGIKIHHWARCTESPDYDDTAALVAELDLVISVPTAVCHLAGALGKECWALTPLRPTWFWCLKGGLMPWHSSVKIIRRTDEEPPQKEIAQIKAMLEARL
jgi:tetratricopeptide (TPR) repeat protein